MSLVIRPKIISSTLNKIENMTIIAKNAKSFPSKYSKPTILASLTLTGTNVNATSQYMKRFSLVLETGAIKTIANISNNAKAKSINEPLMTPTKESTKGIINTDKVILLLKVLI